MQFIDRNSFDVRAAVYRLTHPEHPLAFELFPMVHLAAPAFYAAVATRLRACDAILFEGVRRPRARMLTKAYELAGGSSELGLVLQRDALRLDEMPGTLLHADVSADDFDRAWRDVPIAHRALVSLLAPIFGLLLRFGGTRSVIARGLQVDDLPEEDVDDFPGWEALERVIVGSRDRHLVQVLREFFQRHRSTPMTAAVVFGAAHIPAAARALMQGCGYRIATADWVVVFPLEDDGNT